MDSLMNYSGSDEEDYNEAAIEKLNNDDKEMIGNNCTSANDNDKERRHYRQGGDSSSPPPVEQQNRYDSTNRRSRHRPHHHSHHQHHKSHEKAHHERRPPHHHHHRERRRRSRSRSREWEGRRNSKGGRSHHHSYYYRGISTPVVSTHPPPQQQVPPPPQNTTAAAGGLGRGVGETSNIPNVATQLGGTPHNDKSYVPGVTGKFREQIEKRKLLWQNKNKSQGEISSHQQQVLHNDNGQQSELASSSSSNWQRTTFAQDNDGKVASKFKRLMGIRVDDKNPHCATFTTTSTDFSENKLDAPKCDNSSTGAKPISNSDILRRQEELFSTMEQQYEVARSTTHTMRGVGLGFGSFQHH